MQLTNVDKKPCRNRDSDCKIVANFTFLPPFPLFCWFKKSSCPLLVKEGALISGNWLRSLPGMWLG